MSFSTIGTSSLPTFGGCPRSIYLLAMPELSEALGDLAVEVRSPSTWRYDIGTNKATYEHHALSELWLVDTESGAVLVYRRSSPSVPDFDVALGAG